MTNFSFKPEPGWHKQLSWSILFLSLLFFVACGAPVVNGEPAPTANLPSTMTNTVSITAEPAPTPAVSLAPPYTSQPKEIPGTPATELGKLAYIQDGDVWVKDLLDGEPQRLTTTGGNQAPHWSPSGQWLAFRQGNQQVWVMSSDGTAAYPLNAGTGVGTYTWAPAADRLAYLTAQGGLRIVNADGSDPQELTAGLAGSSGRGRVGLESQ